MISFVIINLISGLVCSGLCLLAASGGRKVKIADEFNDYISKTAFFAE